MYLRQNSHSHRRPSGTTAYSCGSGVWNHVSISYAPKRIMRTGSALPELAHAASTASASADGCGPTGGGASPSCRWAARRLRSKHASSSGVGTLADVSASSPSRSPANGASSVGAGGVGASSPEEADDEDTEGRRGRRAGRSGGTRRRTTCVPSWPRERLVDARGAAGGAVCLVARAARWSAASHSGQNQRPRGGLSRGGVRQYRCHPRSHRSQNMICSSSPFSPHTSQILHSMQRHAYVRTAASLRPVTSHCMQEACPALVCARATYRSCRTLCTGRAPRAAP